MRRNRWFSATLVAALACTTALAQTTSPGTAVDVELTNPADGSNTFVVSPQETFTVDLFVRPGSDSLECRQDCRGSETILLGGPAHLAAAVVELVFDPGVLELVGAENNPDTAAADGLLQEQHLAEGRIGWALAGDWTPDATPSGGLTDPCHAATLDLPGWVLRLHFKLLRPAATTLHIARRGDERGVPPSFADACGSAAFTDANGGIDEIVDGAVVPRS